MAAYHSERLGRLNNSTDQWSKESEIACMSAIVIATVLWSFHQRCRRTDALRDRIVLVHYKPGASITLQRDGLSNSPAPRQLYQTIHCCPIWNRHFSLAMESWKQGIDDDNLQHNIIKSNTIKNLYQKDNCAVGDKFSGHHPSLTELEEQGFKTVPKPTHK